MSFLGYSGDTLTPSQHVRLELRARPGRYLTMATLVELTGLTVNQVNSAIQILTRQHKILRRVPSAMARQNSRQAYCWDYRRVH